MGEAKKRGTLEERVNEAKGIGSHKKDVAAYVPYEILEMFRTSPLVQMMAKNEIKQWLFKRKRQVIIDRNIFSYVNKFMAGKKLKPIEWQSIKVLAASCMLSQKELGTVTIHIGPALTEGKSSTYEEEEYRALVAFSDLDTEDYKNIVLNEFRVPPPITNSTYKRKSRETSRVYYWVMLAAYVAFRKHRDKPDAALLEFIEWLKSRLYDVSALLIAIETAYPSKKNCQILKNKYSQDTEKLKAAIENAAFDYYLLEYSFDCALESKDSVSLLISADAAVINIVEQTRNAYPVGDINVFDQYLKANAARNKKTIRNAVFDFLENKTLLSQKGDTLSAIIDQEIKELEQNL